MRTIIIIVGLMMGLSASAFTGTQISMETSDSPMSRTAEVTCVDGDCMHKGWNIYFSNNRRSFVTCLRGSCFHRGWLEESAYTDTAITRCGIGGCFDDGWSTINARTHQRISTVRCHRIDDESGHKGGDHGDGDHGDHKHGHACLESGWTTWQFGVDTQSICEDGNCAKYGWKIYPPNGRTQVVRCKKGGCFREGWTLRY